MDDSGRWTRVYAPGEEPPPPAAEGEDADPAAEGSSAPDDAPLISLSLEDDEGAERAAAPGLFRWEREHRVETVDDAFVLELNREPLVPMFLWKDNSAPLLPPPPPEDGAEPPPPEASENDGESEGGDRAVMRSHYEHATMLDLSPLLAGELIVERTFGAHPTATALAEAIAASTGDGSSMEMFKMALWDEAGSGAKDLGRMRKRGHQR